MSPAQRDTFMWEWGKRRARGRMHFLLLAAGIGAAGGVLFTVMMMGMSGGNLRFSGMPEEPAYTIAGQLQPLISAIIMLGMAVPAFGFLGGLTAFRIWNGQEFQYQKLLEQGAVPPTQKPAALQGMDRAPQIAVFIAFGVIALFILFIAIFVA